MDALSVDEAPVLEPTAARHGMGCMCNHEHPTLSIDASGKVHLPQREMQTRQHTTLNTLPPRRAIHLMSSS